MKNVAGVCMVEPARGCGGEGRVEWEEGRNRDDGLGGVGGSDSAVMGCNGIVPGSGSSFVGNGLATDVPSRSRWISFEPSCAVDASVLMSRSGEFAETRRQWATQYLLWSSSISESSLMLKSVIMSCSTGGGSIGLLSLPSGPALAARGCCRICSLKRGLVVELIDLEAENVAARSRFG